jgi:hypothetical protein
MSENISNSAQHGELPKHIDDGITSNSQQLVLEVLSRVELELPVRTHHHNTTLHKLRSSQL